MISIHPEFVEKIFKGYKQFEYRKTYINANVFFIYETAPVSAVVGFFNASCTKASPDYVWKYTGAWGGIGRDEFFKYFEGKKKAFCYNIYGFVKFAKPVPLEYFGLKRAPQSFCYLENIIKGDHQ